VQKDLMQDSKRFASDLFEQGAMLLVELRQDSGTRTQIQHVRAASFPHTSHRVYTALSPSFPQ
jgi:hypothetical protein